MTKTERSTACLLPTKRRHRRPARHGLAACELAIMLPFFTFMVMVAVDYCRIFYLTHTLWNSAYAGALYASGMVQRPSTMSAADAATQAAIRECASLNPPLQAGNVQISSNVNAATVTVTYQFIPITTVFMDAGGVTLSRTVTVTSAPVPGQ